MASTREACRVELNQLGNGGDVVARAVELSAGLQVDVVVMSLVSLA